MSMAQFKTILNPSLEEFNKIGEEVLTITDILVSLAGTDPDFPKQVQTLNEKVKQLRQLQSSIVTTLNDEMNSQQKKMDDALQKISLRENALQEKSGELQQKNGKIIEMKKTNEIFFKGNKGSNKNYNCQLLGDHAHQLCREGWTFVDKQSDGKVKSQIVCTIGNFNKGKSFILGYLADKPFPTGFQIHTEGLSGIYAHDSSNAIMYLDTKGFETPIPFNIWKIWNSTPENIIKDRKICESLIQKFIIEKSSLILVVVTKMTYSDQVLIEALSKAYGINPDNSKDKNKQVLVVHNFMELSTREDVEFAIKEDITDVYEVDKIVVPGMNIAIENSCYYGNSGHTPSSDHNKMVKHIIMAREGTDAGDYYNPAAKKFIKAIITQTDVRREFEPAKELTEFLRKEFPKYLEVPKEFLTKDPTNIRDILSPEILTLQESKFESHPDGWEKKYELKLGIVTPKFKDVYFDILDQMISEEHASKIDYDIIRKDNQVAMNFEFGGMNEEEIKTSVKGFTRTDATKGYYVILSGVKIVDKAGDVLVSNRKYDKFEFHTPALEYGKFSFVDWMKPKRAQKDGLLTLMWQLSAGTDDGAF